MHGILNSLLNDGLRIKFPRPNFQEMMVEGLNSNIKEDVF